MSSIDPTKIPVIPPPKGHTSHFDGPWNSLQHGVVISFSITFAISTIFLLLRFFQAIKLVKKLDIDLAIITISYGISILYFTTVLRMIGLGAGRHLWNVSQAEFAQFSQGTLLGTLSYTICLCITKIAILSILYRINPSFMYRFAIIAIGTAVFTYTITLSSITGGVFNPSDPRTYTPIQNNAVAHAVLNIASDLAIIAVPIPTICGLNLSLKQKTSIGCIMTIGSGVVICSIARLPYVITLKHDRDATYITAILSAWSIIEVNLGITCVCGMRLKLLVNVYLPRFKGYWFSISNPRGTVDPVDSSLRLDPRGGQQSFQLHNVRENHNDLNGRDQGIHVYRSYNVDLEEKDTGRGSTEEILAGRMG